jgi:hypothetical protein
MNEDTESLHEDPTAPEVETAEEADTDAMDILGTSSLNVQEQMDIPQWIRLH